MAQGDVKKSSSQLAKGNKKLQNSKLGKGGMAQMDAACVLSQNSFLMLTKKPKYLRQRILQ